MKKFKFLFCTIIILSLLSTCLFGCKSKEDPTTMSNNISYIQNEFYHGVTKNFEVKLCTGKSEVLFVADGKTNDTKDFSTITIIPNSVDLYNYEYSYKLIGSEQSIEGTLVKDSFGAYFSTDVSFKEIGTPTSIELSYGKMSSTIPLVNMLQDSIDSKQALEIAQQSLAEKLKTDNKEREIYVRMINNSNKPESEYFWYVAFINSPTDYYSCLIKPKDGTVINVTE